LKETLEYKGFLGSIEIAVDDECLHGKVMFIDDLLTYEADSIKELKTAFITSVDDYLDTCAELGRAPSKPFSGTFNVRIGPDLHQKLARYATQNNSSLNEVVKKAVAEYIEKPKSQDVIHQHFYTLQYNETLNIEETPWSEEKQPLP